MSMDWLHYSKRIIFQVGKIIDIKGSIDTGMVVKSTYSYVQQTRLEERHLSSKAEITHRASPWG
jgi:hypothetical protein